MGKLLSVASVVLRPYRFPLFEVVVAVALLLSIPSLATSMTLIAGFKGGTAVRVLNLAMLAASAPAFIALLTCIIYGWSFASMISRGEVLTLLSMPVSRRAVLALACAGFVAAPLAVLIVPTALSTYFYAPDPNPKWVALGVAGVAAVPSIVYSVTYLATTLTKSRWVPVATGLGVSMAVSMVGGLTVFTVAAAKQRISLATAIAISCLNPIAGSLNLYELASARIEDLLTCASVIDFCICAALCLATIYVVSRRWEPV